jgi:hypothetical protein
MRSRRIDCQGKAEPQPIDVVTEESRSKHDPILHGLSESMPAQRLRIDYWVRTSFSFQHKVCDHENIENNDRALGIDDWLGWTGHDA